MILHSSKLCGIVLAGALAFWAVDISRADFTVERVLGGLNQPTYLTHAPGDPTSLFIVERNDGSNQTGRIRRYDLLTGAFSTFLEVNGTVVEDGGLLGLTFHPDYQSNGLFYVLGTNGSTSALDEYKVVAGAPQLQRRIIQYSQLAHVWHTIDQAHFRPNGNNNELFVLTGDGGTQANEGSFNPTLIEDPNSIYGKILRVDLTADFTTPANAASHPGIDVVALGIRNPYRSSFDRQTGDFYFGDVGFTLAEELNYIPASHFASPAATPLDFGWTSREGTAATSPSPPGGAGSPGDRNPIFDYSHNASQPIQVQKGFTGFAVVGGYVYRGPVAELQGRYFFAEHVLGRVYSALFDTNTDPGTFNGNNFTSLTNHTVDFESRIGGADVQLVSSYGEDPNGNLYFAKIGTASCQACGGSGEVFRIMPTVADALEATVDRDIGTIVLRNSSTEDVRLSSLAIASRFGALSPDSLKPITGNYDASGLGTIDDNDDWMLVSPFESHSLLHESTSGDAGTLAPGQQIELALTGGWIASPTEDVRIAVLLDDDTVVWANVNYTGNGGNPFRRSDFDFDNELDEGDWLTLLANHRQDLSTLSLAEAYRAGDLNGDGKNDFFDFRLFQNDYIAANGQAAFLSLRAEIPEPSSWLLALLSVALISLARM